MVMKKAAPELDIGDTNKCLQELSKLLPQVTDVPRQPVPKDTDDPAQAEAFVTVSVATLDKLAQLGQQAGKLAATRIAAGVRI